MATLNSILSPATAQVPQPQTVIPPKASKPNAASGSNSQKAITTAAMTASIPAATPIPQGLFTQIIDNTRNTLQASRQIAASATNQARTDRAEGKGLMSGMREFTSTVNDLMTLMSNQARASGHSPSQQEKLTLEQLGAIAQDYAYLSARESLIEGATSITGQSSRALSEMSTIDLILENLSGSPQPGNHSAPAGSGVAATGIGAGAGKAGLSPGASVSSQILGAVGAAYGAYQVLANWGRTDPVSGAINGFTAGAYLGGATFGPMGAAVGGVIGGIVGLASGLFSRSGKSADQVARDQVRTLMQNSGMITENWELSLANGVLYDIGKDGKFELRNMDGSSRRAYEVDFGNPLAAETVAMVQPLGMLIAGGNRKLANQISGYFANAALSNATDLDSARKNATAILKSIKIPAEQLAQGIAAMVKQGAISEADGKIYLKGLMTVATPNDTGSSDDSGASSNATGRGKKAA